MAFIMNVKVLKKPNVQKGMMIGIFILLLLTLVIGKNINGSKSWINLGFMNLQASELLKIAIILYIPFMIEKKMPAVRHNIKLILGPILFVVTCLILVLFSKRCWSNNADCDHILLNYFLLRYRCAEYVKMGRFGSYWFYHRSYIYVHVRYGSKLFASTF